MVDLIQIFVYLSNSHAGLFFGASDGWSDGRQQLLIVDHSTSNHKCPTAHSAKMIFLSWIKILRLVGSAQLASQACLLPSTQ